MYCCCCLEKGMVFTIMQGCKRKGQLGMSCYLWNYVRKWVAKAAAAVVVVDGFAWSSLSCNNTGVVPDFNSSSRIFSVWQKSHSCHTRLCSKPNISNQISSITKWVMWATLVMYIQHNAYCWTTFPFHYAHITCIKFGEYVVYFSQIVTIKRFQASSQFV